MNIKITIIQKIFILFLIIGSNVLYANKIVSISTLKDYSPFVFVDKHLTIPNHEIIAPNSDSKFLKGYSWEVVRESFHIQGYTIKLDIIPWARCVKYVQHHKTDLIFPALRNSKREKEFYFSKLPTDEQNLVIYLKKDSLLEFDGLESLDGLMIGTVKDWSFGEDFDSANYILKEHSYTVLSSLKKLIRGSLDGVVGYEITYDYEIKQNKLSKKLKKTTPFYNSMEYIIGAKNNKNSQKLLDIYDEGKRLIIQNGTFKKINKKWLIDENQ